MKEEEEEEEEAEERGGGGISGQVQEPKTERSLCRPPRSFFIWLTVGVRRASDRVPWSSQ